MADLSDSKQNISVNVPLGTLAVATLIGLAAATYFLLSRGEDSPLGNTGQAARSGKGMMRRAGLITFAAMIENDLTRRLVVAAIRAMARRL